MSKREGSELIWLDDGGVYAEWREDGGVTVAACGLEGVFLWPEQQQRLIEVLNAGPPISDSESR